MRDHSSAHSPNVTPARFGSSHAAAIGCRETLQDVPRHPIPVPTSTPAGISVSNDRDVHDRRQSLPTGAMREHMETAPVRQASRSVDCDRLARPQHFLV